MVPTQVWSVYWSATGNTRQTAEVIGKELAQTLGCGWKALDFTLPADRTGALSFQEGEVVVFAMPTYAGKLPNKLLPYVQEQTAGNGALAVPVVTFGNRSFDNSLAELTAVLTRNGFHPVAAGAFVGRHAFTDDLAPGRPNEADQEEMRAFARQAARKVTEAEQVPPSPAVPGDSEAPYYVPKGVDGAPAKFLKAKPKTDPAKCTNCGDCARSCPMGAIDLQNVAETPGTCIKCQRCVRLCPTGAKYFDDPAFLSHVEMLRQNFSARKENQTFV